MAEDALTQAATAARAGDLERQEVVDEALSWAARNNQCGTMGELVARGANVNANPFRGTPLLWACYSDKVEAAAWLLDHGADPDLRHDWGGEGHGVRAVAMHLAAQHDAVGCVKLLLDRGADATVVDGTHGGTPLGWAGERILFAARDGVVTTHVQIQYTGEAADFAWILPVPSPPEVRVSHNELFRQLGSATSPTFFLDRDWEFEEACGYGMEDFLGGCSVCADTGGGPPVEVVFEDRVGPYESVVITADDPQAVVDWLTDNNYQLGDTGPELLAHTSKGDTTSWPFAWRRIAE